jgi:hypothetical protein
MSLFEHEVEKVELLREIRDSLRVLVEDRGTPTKKLFTKAEVRARLGISNDTIERKVKSGEWQVHYVTDEIPRFHIDDFEGGLRTTRIAPRVNRRNGGLQRTGQIEKFMEKIKKEG